MGREADRLAEQARRHERRVAERAARLHDCICFCIVTLADNDIADEVARRTVLDALRIGRAA
jgi:hypothetical protein